MTRITYEQALADHIYLWDTYGPASDMTGGYVDQDDLKLLLCSPTKMTALTCLLAQIEYWFDVGPAEDDYQSEVNPHDPILIEIAERYNREIPE